MIIVLLFYLIYLINIIMSYGIVFIYNISIDINSDEDKLEL